MLAGGAKIANEQPPRRLQRREKVFSWSPVTSHGLRYAFGSRQRDARVAASRTCARRTQDGPYPAHNAPLRRRSWTRSTHEHLGDTPGRFCTARARSENRLETSISLDFAPHHHPVPRPVRVPPRISRVSFEGAQRRSDEPRTTVGEHRNGTARVSRRGSSSPRDSLHLPASNEAGFAAIGPLLKIGPTKRFHCTSIPAGHCACSVRRPLPRTPQRTIFVESVGPVERERRVCGCRVRVFKIDFGSGPGGAPWARLGQRLDRRAARPTTHVDRLGELIRVWATRLEPQDGGNRKFGAGGCGVGLPAHGKAL
ncbi:hypothetical protein V8D89_006343 [Ganoderma adspersum]